MGSPIAAEIMAQGSFDFLILDTEHAPGTNDTLYHQLRACDACGMPVIVRLPTVDPGLIKHALDAGASGLAIPDMRTADQAQALVHHSRYAPQGTRGTHRVARAAGYGFGWQNYLQNVAPNLLMMALIESPEGVTALRGICQTDGLDAVFVGSVDLAACLGRASDPTHQSVKDAVTQIEATVLEQKMALGGLAANQQQANTMFKRGYHMASVGSDLVFLRDEVKRASKEADAKAPPTNTQRTSNDA